MNSIAIHSRHANGVHSAIKLYSKFCLCFKALNSLSTTLYAAFVAACAAYDCRNLSFLHYITFTLNSALSEEERPFRVSGNTI